MNKAKVIENFMSEEDCKYLITTVISSDLWESGGSEFWDNRVINYYSMLKFDRDADVRCKY